MGKLWNTTIKETPQKNCHILAIHWQPDITTSGTIYY